MTCDPKDVDRFLGDLSASEGEHGLEVLSELFAPRDAPLASATERARLLAAAVHEGRLWRFAGPVAELLDLPLERARALLDRLDDPRAWHAFTPGIALCWVEGGPRVQRATRGFLRIDAGVRAPDHEHVGTETTLVLQGACRDVVTGKIMRPGDSESNGPDSSHAIEALPGGPDLLQLAVVQGGVRIGGRLFGPR